MNAIMPVELRMPYPSLMYLHYVMEAQDHFRQAQQEATPGGKLDELAAAFEALRQANEHGAPNEIIRELRFRYYQEFLSITKEEPPIL